MVDLNALSPIELWEGACLGFSAETGYEWYDYNDLDDVEPNVIAFGGALEAINDTIYTNHGTGDEIVEPLENWREAFAAFFTRYPRYLSRDLVKCARRVDLHLTPVL